MLFTTVLVLNACRGIPGPFLVVAPLSTVAHWQREIESWTGMNTVVFHVRVHSSRSQRDSLIPVLVRVQTSCLRIAVAKCHLAFSVAERSVLLIQLHTLTERV